ncbi:MAG: hypothetical protein AAFV98_13935 [Chloroflexota bacterium]
MPVIQIFAFRGTGGFQNPKYKSLPGLIKAGHVGIKFENDPVIYGFHPSLKAQEDVGGEDKLLNLLLQHEPQEGILQDDTAIFLQAKKLSESGARTAVWVLDREVDDEAYETIKQQTIQWYTDGKVFQYNLPKRDGSFNSNEYNCAVFPKLLGIDIPLDNGKVYLYIEKMIELGASEWQPTRE